MWTRWQACLRSILEYILAGAGDMSRSEMRGSGWSFSVTLFRAQKSMHRQRLLSFFLMNKMGEPHGDLLGQMKPFLVCSLRNSHKAMSSGGTGSRLVHEQVLHPLQH